MFVSAINKYQKTCLEKLALQTMSSLIACRLTKACGQPIRNEASVQTMLPLEA